MKFFQKLAPVLLFTLTACGGGNESPNSNPATTTNIYKSLGHLQCTGGGTSLASLVDQLTSAGIQVLASACGTDGNAHPALCGAYDGSIGIFEIPASQESATLALGYSPLSTLPSAFMVPCK